MGTHLINKVLPPKLDLTLDRERLFDQLEIKNRRPAIWISGPAGSGKSSLLASYLNRRQSPCLWYQCGTEDGDPATFFFYLASAAEQSGCRPSGKLPLFTPEYRQGLDTFGLRYFEKLFSLLPQSSFLVFDNYQDIPEGTAVPDLLNKVIQYTPPDLTIAFISRFQPPQSLVRLMLNGVIGTLGWPDIAFTKVECKALYELLSGQKPDASFVDAIHRRTKGWVAGMILLMANRDEWTEAPCFSETEAPVPIFDYFASEILKKTDSPTRTFLLRSSLVAEMSHLTLSALFNETDYEMILDGLHRRNFFIERRNGSQTTYQYHPLFRNFLRNQAIRALAPAVLTDTLCQAAEACANSGQLEEAVSLFAEAEAWPRLSSLIQIHAFELFLTGRHHTLSKWLNHLPREFIGQEPWLCFWKGVCLLPADPLSGRQYCEQAFQRFNADGDGTGKQLSLAAAVESYFLARGDMNGLDRWIRSGETLKIAWDEPVPIPITGRFAAAMLGAMTIRAPGHPAINRWIDRCTTLLHRSEDVELSVLFANFLVLIHCWQGEVARAGALLDRLKPKLTEKDVPPSQRIFFSVVQCVYYLATGESDRNRMETDAALSLAELTGVHVYDGLLASYGAYATLSTDEMAAAASYLEIMGAKLEPKAVIDIAHYHCLRAWEAMIKGDLSVALTLVETAMETGFPAGAPIATVICGNLLLVKILIAQKNYADALRLMNETLGSSTKHGCLLMDFHEQLTLAYLNFSLNNDAEGLNALRRAFERSRIMGILDGNWWVRSDLSELCRRALDAQIETEQVRKYIQRNRLMPPIPETATVDWPWQIHVHILGEMKIRCDGNKLAHPSKRPKKPMELMKVLVCSGPAGIRREKAADLLWPDADGDRSLQNLDTTIHRLRRLLTQERTVIAEGGRLRLSPQHCWVDAWHFEAFLKQAHGQASHEESVQVLEKALNCWSGPLSGLSENSVAISYRERLNDRLAEAIFRLATLREDGGDTDGAVSIYQRGLVLDDTAEPLYQELMKLYYRMGKGAEAASVYRRCKQILKTKAGMSPNPSTQALLDSFSFTDPDESHRLSTNLPSPQQRSLTR